MNWTGKLIGALLGFALTKRPTGVLLGLVLGRYGKRIDWTAASAGKLIVWYFVKLSL